MPQVSLDHVRAATAYGLGRVAAIEDELTLPTYRTPYQRFQDRYRTDPAGFVQDCVQWYKGEHPTDYQLEILRDFIAYGREAVRMPRGGGKTALAALLTHWFALTRDDDAGYDWKVITTASAWQQLIHYTWPEIHKWARRLDWAAIGREPYNERTELLQQALKLRYGEAFAVASEVPDRIEGAHAHAILYVFDEAKIIPDAVFDSAEGSFVNANGPDGKEAYAFAISIPGEPVGRFYKIHRRDPGVQDWHVRHVTTQETIAAGRMQPKEQERLKQLWGETSQLYQNHVLGEFAANDASGIIPLAWVEAAVNRWYARYDANTLYDGDGAGFTCLGLDIGDGGGDPSVLAFRYGSTLVAIEEHPTTTDLMQMAGWAAHYLDTLSGYAVVDAIGVGSGVVARLNELGHSVLPFVASSVSRAFDKSGSLRMANARAEAWYHLRDLLDPTSPTPIALPPNDTLIADLTTPRYRMLSNGRVKIEEKDEIRKRLGRSTDYGDAVVQAFYRGADELGSYGLVACPDCSAYYERTDYDGNPRSCPFCAGTSPKHLAVYANGHRS